MTVYRLMLPFSRPSPLSNCAVRSHHHHWSRQRTAKAEVQRAVWTMATQQRIPRLELCTVCLTWFPPDRRRRDPDALAVMAKASLDGLIKAGVLSDDDGQHVAGVLLRIGEPAKPARIELAIADSGGVKGIRELHDATQPRPRWGDAHQ